MWFVKRPQEVFLSFCFIFLFGRQVAVEGGTRLRRRMGTDPGQALSC